MRKAVPATIAVLVALVAFLLGDRWLDAELARNPAAAALADGVAGVGPAPPGWLVFLIRADHFLWNYPHLMLPILWAVAFAALRRPRDRPGPAKG